MSGENSEHDAKLHSILEIPLHRKEMASSNNVLSGKQSDPFKLDDSNLSSISIFNELGTSAVSDTSADLQLRFQRLLAESALETSGFADLSAASFSSKNGIQNDFISGTSTPYTSAHSSIFGELNAQKNEEYEALFKKYSSEEFVPAEKALDQLMADELAWRKEYGLPPTVNEKLELSCFSGIIGEADLSVRSSVAEVVKNKNKISADEYFGLKTDNVGSLNKTLDNKERPNFGNEIQSPVSRPRIAFVEDSIKEELAKLGESNNGLESNISHNSTAKSTPEAYLNSTLVDKSSCTLSVTSIEDILSKHLLDTPGTIARSILNTKGKTKTPGIENLSLDQISAASESTLKNDSHSNLTDWISVDMPQTEYESIVGSNIDVSFDIENQSTRWLKCSLFVHKVMKNQSQDTDPEEETLPIFQFPEITLIGPGQKAVQTVKITPVMPGNFEIHVTVNSEDAVTQLSQKCVTKFELSCKIPKVEILLNGAVASEVDFGVLPEGCSQLTKLEIRNYSDMKVPMTVEIEEVSSTNTFFLNKNDSQANETLQSHPEGIGKSLKISVAFRAPSLKDKTETVNGKINFTAYLNVSIDVPERKSYLLKKLKLKGCVGVTQLLLGFTSPVELSSPGPGIANSKTLVLKNGGVIPLKLKLMILDPKSWQIESEGVITVNNPKLNIQPGKEALFTLVFSPAWTFEELIERKLVIHITPDGNLFEIDICAKMIDSGTGRNKERLSTQSAQSIGSSVTSTMSRGVGGMPVQTTHKQLVWNTVPIGKSERQSCRIRNAWSTPIKVLLTLVDSSHGFWLLNENGEHVLERKIKLHAQETIPIHVVFCPSKIGAAYGKIIVREATRGDTAERFAIPLSGYAGTFNLSIKNIPKDKSGHMWINLGPLDTNLQTHFSIYNRGNLDAFVFINYSAKGIGALLQGPSVNINPSKIVIAPGSHENINVNFCLQSDVSFISKDSRDVLELGILYLTCGDEPSRQRIRRIKDRQSERSVNNKILDLNSLCSSFPGETIISDLGSLNDPETAIRSLYRTFLQHEIALTVEKTDDRSMAMQTCIGNGHFVNESLIFKSILPDSTLCSSSDNGMQVSAGWNITPSTLTLLVPQFASGCITISSASQEDQNFEVSCCDEFVSVEPSSGVVPSQGEAVAVVTCDAKAIKTSLNVKSSLKVYLGNDVKIVTIHIKHTPDALVHSRKFSNKFVEASKTEVNEKKKTVPSTAAKLKMQNADLTRTRDSRKKTISNAIMSNTKE